MRAYDYIYYVSAVDIFLLLINNRMNLSSKVNSVVKGGPLTKGVSITSSDVIDNYNSLLAKIKDPATAAALNRVEAQQEDSEVKLVANTTVCDVPMLSSLRDRIGGLQAAQLKDFTLKQLHNPSAMKAAMCTADSIFYTSPYDIGSLYLNNRIRMYIHNLRQMGGESAEGYALIADFENAKDMFVVKVSRSPSDDTLLHELVVGLYGTNKLRQYIPNFAYVYGGFKCSPPLIDPETKKVVTWCLHDTNPVNYVLYENINPAVTMSKYLQTCTGKDFVNVYLQVLYALRLALKVSDYTHYDLHYENVLIRHPSPGTINGPFQIAYETERGVEYVLTHVIPTFVDYGFSHIKTADRIDSSGKIVEPGKHYGKSGLVPFSIFAYRSWIMHDLYKFLMFCILGASQHNNRSVLVEATKIFRFFNATEDPIAAINSQSSTLFAFPLIESTNKITADDLASHIRTLCDCSFINHNRTSDPVLDCERVCLTSGEILNQVGMDPNGPIGTPDNIIEFYDIAVRLQNENRELEKTRIAQAYPYQHAIRSHIDKMHELVRDLIDLRRKLKLVDVSKMALDQVLQYNTMMIVRSMYVSVAAIVDKTIQLRFFNEIGTAVARSYEDENAVRVMDNIMDRFNRDVRPGLEDSKMVLGLNHNYLNRIQSDDIVVSALKRDQRLRWYWDGRNLFDVVFGRVASDINSKNTPPITLVTTRTVSP